MNNDAKINIFSNIPTELPSLSRAYRMGEKASHVGFDWKNAYGALAKVEEELTELKEALREKDQNHIEHELGDLLQATANLCRHSKVDPESALRASLNRFESRFCAMEGLIKESKKKLSSLSLEKITEFWEKAKKLTEYPRP